MRASDKGAFQPPASAASRRGLVHRGIEELRSLLLRLALLHTSSARTWAGLIASVASLVDAIACLIFQVVLTAPGTGARLWIMLLIDPIACILGYWVICQRLRETRPNWPSLAFTY